MDEPRTLTPEERLVWRAAAEGRLVMINGCDMWRHRSQSSIQDEVLRGSTLKALTRLFQEGLVLRPEQGKVFYRVSERYTLCGICHRLVETELSLSGGRRLSVHYYEGSLYYKNSDETCLGSLRVVGEGV